MRPEGTEAKLGGVDDRAGAAIDGSLGTRPIRIAGRNGREVLYRDLRIDVLSGPDAGRSAMLASSSMIVGTGPECDLRLTDPTVSSRHAAVVPGPAGVLVEDLDSTNGVTVRGLRVRSTYVESGTDVKLGETVLRIDAPSGRLVALASQAELFRGLIGRSEAMREVFGLIEQLSQVDLPVLVTGETGTGKELVARALHEGGQREKKPFLVMDCGAVVADLLRSELFGYERGAFTGASEARAGLLEQAAGGTVFFDEIGELPLSLQPNLLRALEAKEVRRIGAARALPVDFRIVGATHRDLARESRDGRFREDLFYRLSCITIRLPPLRERKEDLPLLASHFLDAFARRNGTVAPPVTDDARAALEAHPWRGNLRELRNAMESASVLARGGPIDGRLVRRVVANAPEQAAPAPTRDVEARVATPPAPESGTLPERLQELERRMIEEALEANRHNKKRTAAQLGISLTTLFEKIRRYGIGQDDRD